MWARGTQNDQLPEGYGIELDNAYLLLMVIYENANNSSPHCDQIISCWQKVVFLVEFFFLFFLFFFCKSNAKITYLVTVNAVNENSGLLLNYEEDNSLKTVNRVMIGHQTSSKHVILSNYANWVTIGICSGYCFNSKNSTMNNQSHASHILGINVYTRYLGISSSLNVQSEKEGSR